MNRPIRMMAIACLVMFTALLVNINYVQVVSAGDLNDRQANKRVINEQFSRDRGPILVAGDPIVESVPSDDQYKFQRTYNEPELYASITGYYSYLYGGSGIEDSQNSVLSGSDNRLFVNRVVDLLANKQPKGGSVELTLDPVAQKTAASGLASLGKNAKGAVVALDPSTGAILAMANQPAYDPNLLASHDFTKVEEAWDSLTKDKDEPMLNRSTQQILPPGSTFKLVTAAAALEDLGLDPGDKVKAGRTLTFPGIDYELTNENNSNCGGATITFKRALNVSCNVSFGSLAGKIGQAKLAEKAADFGFGTDPLDGLAASPSRFTSEGADLEAPQLAQSGIGQYEVATTPLQMAMVTAGIANDGDVMKPYIVKTVRSPNLKVLEQADPMRLSQAMSGGDAAKLKKMLVSTVTDGTATAAQIPGVDVGGKTGTAQSTPERPPYAWFVAFAPANNPQVAVAVIVESTNVGRDEISGGRLAGPIARSVMEAILNK